MKGSAFDRGEFDRAVGVGRVSALVSIAGGETGGRADGFAPTEFIGMRGC